MALVPYRLNGTVDSFSDPQVATKQLLTGGGIVYLITILKQQKESIYRRATPHGIVKGYVSFTNIDDHNLSITSSCSNQEIDSDISLYGGVPNSTVSD